MKAENTISREQVRVWRDKIEEARSADPARRRRLLSEMVDVRNRLSQSAGQKLKVNHPRKASVLHLSRVALVLSLLVILCIGFLIFYSRANEASSDPATATRVRFTSHQARFSKAKEYYYFVNVSNIDVKSIEITHVWYEDAGHYLPVRRDSRPLPKRLEPSEAWSSWIPVNQLPQGRRADAYDRFRLRLSTGEVFSSVKDETVPSFGSVPGGEVLERDIVPDVSVDD